MTGEPLASTIPAVASLATRRSAGRIYATLVAGMLFWTALGYIPTVLNPERPGGGLGFAVFLYTVIVLPIVPAALWIWWWSRRFDTVRGPWGQSWLRWLVAPVVFLLVLKSTSTLLRVGLQGGVAVLRFIKEPGFWLSTLYQGPIWYIMLEMMAWVSLLQHRAIRDTAALLRQQQALDRAEAERTANQLRMIRTYLRPHFLFNTLNSISSMLEVAPQQARQALALTADLLRETLVPSDDDDLVPLIEELSVTRRYLVLEQMRMEERLRVIEHVDPTLLSQPVPRFLVQTFVENAVRHGLFPKPGGGTVQITIRREAEALRIEVLDDGVGAEPAAVEHASGIGVRSARERLRLMHEHGASVEVETAPGRGFRIVARWPLDRDVFDAIADHDGPIVTTTHDEQPSWHRHAS